MKKIKILITSCLGKTGHLLAAQLKKSKNYNYEVFGSDMNKKKLPIKYFEKIFKVPRGNKKNYIKILINHLRKNKIKFILPGSDEEAISLSNSKVILNKYKIIPLISGKNELNLISNKYNTYKYLKSKKINVPNHYIIKNEKEFDLVLKLLDYPNKNIVIKPSQGRGGRDVIYLKGKRDIPLWLMKGQRVKVLRKTNSVKKILKKKNDFIVMPLLNTPCYDVDVLKIFGHKKKYECVLRKRLNPNGLPYKGYEIIKYKKLENYVCSIYKELNLKSLHDFDIMTDQNGSPVLLEVNPRPSGSLVASLMAGIPVIDLAISSKLKMHIYYEQFDKKKLYINF